MFRHHFSFEGIFQVIFPLGRTFLISEKFVSLQSLLAHPDCTAYENGVQEMALINAKDDFFLPLNRRIDQLQTIYAIKISELQNYWTHTVQLGRRNGSIASRLKIAATKILQNATRATTKIKAIRDQRNKYSDLYSSAKAANFRNSELNTKFLDQQRGLCAELGTEMWMELAYFDFVIRSMVTEAGIPFPYRKTPEILLPVYNIPEAIKSLIKDDTELLAIWKVFNNDREEMHRNYNVNELYTSACNEICSTFFLADVVIVKGIFEHEKNVFEQRSKDVKIVARQKRIDVQIGLGLFAQKIDELSHLEEMCMENAAGWMEYQIANKQTTGTAGAFFSTLEDFYKLKRDTLLGPIIQTGFKLMYLIDYVLNNDGASYY